MPGLQSFCVCTAIGLGSIYLLQVTWFTAWLTLDERRIEMGGDGIIPCYTHQHYDPQDNFSLDMIITRVKSVYQSLLGSSVYKMIVIMISLVLFGFGVYGWIEIKQIFYPFLLMPSDSYLRQWISNHKQLYPDDGWAASIYSGPVSASDLDNIDTMVTGLETLSAERRHVRGVDCWWSSFREYYHDQYNTSHWHDLVQKNNDNFSMILSDFLFSSFGAKYKSSFKFAGDLVCNRPAPEITASKCEIFYVTLTEPSEHIPALNTVTDIITRAGSPYHFSHSKIYASWETDIIIGSELWRNLGLSITAVIVVTFLLLCNVQVCVLVVAMVTLSLTNIIGFLHFWGITIDIISCINIVLSVGLCVDYSVHIGHAYLVARGSGEERSVEAVLSIGPAVLAGGVTTFLALVLCSMSTGHVFLTFFKVFTLTVVFGLYNGLILFPVILSLIGPSSSSSSSSSRADDNTQPSSRNKIVLTKHKNLELDETSRDRNTHNNNGFIGEEPGLPSSNTRHI